MTLDEFWSLIDRSRRGNADDPDAQAERLVELLAKLPPAEIEAFDRLMADRRAEAYRWDLWGAAYIVNGGCSDDGFEYFRGWLISRGRKFYEAALADPQHVARGLGPDPEEVECEQLLYAAGDAYRRATGRDLPPTPVEFPDEPAGRRWEEDDLPALFPRLWKRFGG